MNDDTATCPPSARPAAPPAVRWRDWPLPARGLAVALLGLAAAFAFTLWPEWRHNPDLSHGWFVPAIFLLLVWEGRRQGPARWLPAGGWVWGVQLAAVAAGLALFGFAALIAASLGWSHSLVHFALACALSSFLTAGLLFFAGAAVRAVPFNWTVLTAVFLWILVAPIPTGTYARLTLKLQMSVTSAVLHALHVLGVPARQTGNLIELSTTTVGVEDACSGIRSLISCVFAGFFFAAWQVRRPGGRAALILLAGPLAIGMNFLRSLTLTLMANAGVGITGFWHDVTGYAILAVTAGLLALLAIAFESPKPAAAAASPAGPKPSGDAPGAAPARLGRHARRQLWTVTAGLAGAAALGTFFFAQTRPAARPAGPPPDLAGLLPASSSGWKALPPANLYLFASTLRTEYLAQRTYLKPGRDQTTQVTFYVGYWPAGQASVSLVASHTPEACWPGSGWFPVAADPAQPAPTLPARTLPRAEYRLFRRDDGFTEHVWFWHVYDGRVITFRDPYSVPALLGLALRYGYRRQGDQVFVRVSSNQPWSALENEPLVQQVFANFSRLGL